MKHATYKKVLPRDDCRGYVNYLKPESSVVSSSTNLAVEVGMCPETTSRAALASNQHIFSADHDIISHGAETSPTLNFSVFPHDYSKGYEDISKPQSSVISSSTNSAVEVEMCKEASCMDTTSGVVPASNQCTSSTDHEISSCPVETLSEMKMKHATYNQVFPRDYCRRYENSLKSQSSAVSSTYSALEVGMCREASCMETTSRAVPPSNQCTPLTDQTYLAEGGDPNPKKRIISMHYPERAEYGQHISTESGDNSEAGQPLNKEFGESDMAEMKGCWLNAGKDGLKAAFPEKQHKTDSCSSDSVRAISSGTSNGSCQEASTKRKSCKLSNNGLEVPAFKGFVLRRAQHTAPKDVMDNTSFLLPKQVNVGKMPEPINNSRNMDSEKVPHIIAGQISETVGRFIVPKTSIAKKKYAEYKDLVKLNCHLDKDPEVAWRIARKIDQQVGSYMVVSESSSYIEEKNYKALKLNSVDSVNPNKKDSIEGSTNQAKSYNEQGSSDSLCTTQLAINSQMSIESEHSCLEVMEPPLEMDARIMHKTNCGLHQLESSSLFAIPKDVSRMDQTRHHCGFDLNEDITRNEGESTLQSVNVSVSSPIAMPIAVVAKSGVPMSLQMNPIQFEGELGWKGSAATSAFRSTVSKSSNKFKGFNGIDLNIAVAAEEDITVNLFPLKNPAAPSTLTHSTVDISSKQVKFSIDLNQLSENDETCPLSCFRASASKRSVGDFDLNDNSSIQDVHTDLCVPNQDNCQFRNGVSDHHPIAASIHARPSHLSSLRPPRWANPMQSFAHGHPKSFMMEAPNGLTPVEKFQRVAPLQPNLTYIPSQPYAGSYNSGVRIDPNEHPRSSTFYNPSIPSYPTDLRETAFLSQISGIGTLPTFVGVPHTMNFAGGPRPSNIAALRPNVNLNGAGNALEKGNGEGNARQRQLLIPANNMSMEGQLKPFQQAPLPFTSMKREPPEAGCDYYQLGHGQVNLWR